MKPSSDSSIPRHDVSRSCIVRSSAWASKNPFSASFAAPSAPSHAAASLSISSAYGMSNSLPPPAWYWRIDDLFSVNDDEPTSCLSRSCASSQTRSFLLLTSSVNLSSLKKNE